MPFIPISATPPRGVYKGRRARRAAFAHRARLVKFWRREFSTSLLGGEIGHYDSFGFVASPVCRRKS